MDNQEYIIINKSNLLKRIEELRKDPIHLEWEHNIKTRNGHSPQQRERKRTIDLELNTLKEILSQSTPLIPEIEKAFDEGFNSEEEVYKGNSTGKIIGKQDYISNLKLDI